MSIAIVLLTAILLGLTSENAEAGTVWREYPPYLSPVSGLTDASAEPDIIGVRVLSGTVNFDSGNTYSGGTELRGGVHQVYAASPFGVGPVSLRGGLMRFNGGYTVANPLTLDGNYSFGYSGGSSFDNDMVFSQPLVLNGDYVLTHLGNGGGTKRWVYFNAGVDDGGSGSNLTIKYGTYNNRGFYIGSGSGYTGATVIHGSTLVLIGTLLSTSEIGVNNEGTFLMYWDSSGADNRLDNGIPVMLRGGSLAADAYQGSGTAQWAADETVGVVTLDYGHSTIRAGGGRPCVTLTVTNLVRNVGSTAFFYRAGSSSAAAWDTYGYGRVKLSGQSAGFIGGWAVARRNEYVFSGVGVQEDSGYDFAWYDAGTDRLSGVLPMIIKSGELRPAQVEGAGDTNHVRTTEFQATLTADISIESLAVAGSYNNDLGGHTLDIVSGGLLHASGSYVITNGALTSSGGSLFLYKLGADMNVDVDIVGATDVSTAGSMRLNGRNAFTGNLYVNSGTLTFTAANTFNRRASVAPGAVLDVEYENALSPTLGLQLWYDGDDYGACNMDQDSHVGWATTNDVFLARGEYTSANLPGYVTGAGRLTVRRTGKSKGMVVIFK